MEINPLLKEKEARAIVIHDNPSVRKLQAEPVQLNYLCGVSDFAEAYGACEIGRATPRCAVFETQAVSPAKMPSTPKRQVLVWTLEVEGQDAACATEKPC